MRGIHDGPDLTTWPDATPDPKRGRALLIVVAVLAWVCAASAFAAPSLQSSSYPNAVDCIELQAGGWICPDGVYYPPFGLQDGPEGVDPLGGRTDAVYGSVVHVGPDHVYPHGGLNDASMTCSREQENACVGICDDAAGPGEITSSSSCHKRFVPVGPAPGMILEWYCICTWVKAPVTAER